MYYANAIILEFLSYKLEEENNEWDSEFGKESRTVKF
jgi:hypothetical protein